MTALLDHQTPLKKMPSALYKFVRQSPLSMSANRASTDAIGALAHWESRASGRAYSVEEDEDDFLVAKLEWSGSDKEVGNDLNSVMEQAGIARQYMELGRVVKVGQRMGVIAVKCQDGNYATFRLMHVPDPNVGDVLTWTDRGAPVGRTTVERRRDKFQWHVEEARFALSEALAMSLAR
jgi:hypothetical protein